MSLQLHPQRRQQFQDHSADATGVTLAWDNPTTQFYPAGEPYNDVGYTSSVRSNTPIFTMLVDRCTIAAQNIGWQHRWIRPSRTRTRRSARTHITTGRCPEDACFLNFAESAPCQYILPPPVTENVTDPCLTPPYPPSGLNVTSATFTGVNLAWTAPPDNDIAGYVVERSTGTLGNWAQVAGSPTNTTATTFTDFVTDANIQDYFYRVMAFDTCSTPGYSGWSNEAQELLLFDPCNPVPKNPTWTTSAPLTATPSSACPGTSAGTVALSWPTATATVGTNIQYEVYRCDSGKNNTECTLVSDNQSQAPSFFTSTGAMSSKTTLRTTSPLPTGTLTFLDTPGKPLKAPASTSATWCARSTRAAARRRRCRS